MLQKVNYNPIICALDTTDMEYAAVLVEKVRDYVGAVKLGLEFFTAHGAAGVKAIEACGLPVFLDLKFHDIPNTVAGAIRATAPLNVFMMTVHTAGGPDMMRMAAEAAHEVAEKTKRVKPLVVGVTVLTSLNQQDMAAVGLVHRLDQQAEKLAILAQQCRLDGVVCSPHEIATLRQACGNEFVLVTPGIRPVGAASGDQKRILTPAEAIAHGSDYLVIGRPITQAEDPAAAAAAIIKSLA